ncbi:MAG: tRNA(Ile)(2)-agmatinylcytidine synthase [Candidatus Thermoplasmatota archaeon]|nr:tRNA(Ile)(2)-agmatinylcytidine synthase [Candidatus Thermoplasmatota archaeon]
MYHRMYIGIDDTDSVKGMCTTYIATEIIAELQNFIDIIGYPRLVRLNPNIPWKTRGNGAICIRVGKGAGKKLQIAEIGGRAIYCYEREFYNNGIGCGNDVKEKIFEKAQEIIERYSEFDDGNTNPGLVLMACKPSPKLYWRGVRGIVDMETVKETLFIKGAIYKGYKNCRGIIGATAAIAWRPKDRTYEIITYRERSRWGSTRAVDEYSVICMDKNFPQTFNNYDYENKRVIIAPHSLCPVLLGIRSNTAELIEPMKTIKSEKIDRWVIFETNQGSDDHLEKMKIAELAPYKSAIVSGIVASTPKTITGGHVFFKITGSGKLRTRTSSSRFHDGSYVRSLSVECAAYEPTKNFRTVIRSLVPGDEVTIYGSIKSYPFTLNIEKIKVTKLVEVRKKLVPICKCGSKMKSIGKDKGYRCKKCGTKTKDIQYTKVERMIKEGFYEVPVCARRHLSKPLKRISVK